MADLKRVPKKMDIVEVDDEKPDNPLTEKQEQKRADAEDRVPQREDLSEKVSDDAKEKRDD